MRTVLRILVTLPGVLFLAMGVRWLVTPSEMSAELGFVLSYGIGRSSQIGDFAAFFLTAGVCILMGVVSSKRIWFYPAALLLLLAATGRVIAWAVHDAAFTGSMIGFEVVVGVLLLLGSRWLEPKS